MNINSNGSVCEVVRTRNLMKKTIVFRFLDSEWAQNEDRGLSVWRDRSLVWLERNRKVKRNEKLRLNATESQKSFQSCRLPATVSIYIATSSKFQIFSFLLIILFYFSLWSDKKKAKIMLLSFGSRRGNTGEFRFSFVFPFWLLFLKSFGFGFF